MLQQPMKEKLYALKLQGMVQALEHQEQDEATRELSFLDRLALLVDQQWNWRQNQALTRRVLAARLRGTACVENIDYRAERGLNRSVIRALAQESAWVANHEHIFVLGPTGVGKSYVASALAQKACRDGYRVYYTRAAALFRDLSLARADGSLRQLLRRLNRIDVLVIDDWVMAPMSEPGEKRLLGDRRGSLPDAIDDLDFAVASVSLARTDRRSHPGRWHPRPVGAQRASHRDARGLHA